MRAPRLADADLSMTIDKDEAKKRLKKLQRELVELQYRLAEARVPVVFAFEGWDAAGKGGAIKRLVENLDPRWYRVHMISKPTQEELDHHYLWRFWQRLPMRGRWAIFDRTWYGRVLVERIEGFCSEDAWKRAFDEINRFESDLIADGGVVLKFFLHISKKEQQRRFDKRASDPLRAWKLSPEDMRNRKKWERYEVAIDEMFARTHTRGAPWHLIPAEDKRHARIAVQEAAVAALRSALKGAVKAR